MTINTREAPLEATGQALLLSAVSASLAPAPEGVGGTSSWYDLAVDFADSGQSWHRYTAGLGVPDSAAARPGAARLPVKVPFLPASPALSAVYSFGYSHAAVNDVRVEKGNLDFYYKGPGSLLVAEGQPLTGTSMVVGGGTEAEYCAIYCVNTRGEAVYLGHTLANDFSDAGLRTAHRNLANLSKLHPSAVCSDVVLADLPAVSTVYASVERDGSAVWRRQGTLGRRAMIYSRALMERLLLRRAGLFPPGTVVYLLLGSCVSSHKDGVELRDGDVITLRDSASGLELTNPVSW
ncbi:hypothetical protein [Actinacidiphila sp. bgisy145]|uniref:hypothetical protein n=1 Tax=Actinacidiphila sp. bgisy145 TaxID=3413792 RepID=UPI003EB87CB7